MEVGSSPSTPGVPPSPVKVTARPKGNPSSHIHRRNWLCLKLKKKYSGKAGVPVITIIADHKECTSNPSSEEREDSGKEERGLNFLNHTGPVEPRPSFCSQDLRFRDAK